MGPAARAQQLYLAVSLQCVVYSTVSGAVSLGWGVGVAGVPASTHAPQTSRTKGGVAFFSLFGRIVIVLGITGVHNEMEWILCLPSTN